MTIRRFRRTSGVTLTELMVATAILSLGILGFFGTFQYITKSISLSRARTIATNVAQEKVENLKNLSYYALLITTASAVDNTTGQAITYDTSNYPPETLTIAGMQFTRYTHVALARIDSNVISTVTYTYPDTGMKQIQVHILWTENYVRKKWGLQNLLENPNVNPLDSSLYGTITKAGGGALPGAVVLVQENPDWNSTSDGSGNYSFRVYHGSYTVKASSAGYYDTVSVLTEAPAGSSGNADLALLEIGSGTVVGNAWISSHVVISQVVVSTVQADWNNMKAQYVELFNPTTYPITIGGAAPPLRLTFSSTCPGANVVICADATYGIKLNYVNTVISSHSYYVIANTSSFMVNGLRYYADAVYVDEARPLSWCANQPGAANWDPALVPPAKDMLVSGHNGIVQLVDSSGRVLDSLGYDHTGQASPSGCEGSCIVFPIGSIQPGQQMVRLSSPAANFDMTVSSAYGRAYDSNSNRADFVYPDAVAAIDVDPRTTQYSTYPVISGVPAVGALVAASDSLSGSTRAYMAVIASGSLSLPYAPFTLVGVATGTWSVIVASSQFVTEISTVTVPLQASTGIPNGATVPSWEVPGVVSVRLSTQAVAGFVEGVVSDVNAIPVPNISVLGPGFSKTTGANGAYFLQVTTGPVTVIANPNNANPFYVQAIAQPTVAQNQILTQNFTLSKGGALRGHVTTGTSPLPNIVVTANLGGSQYGSATSDVSGSFTIKNLSTATYTVEPVLDPGQTSSPGSLSSTVSSTVTVFIGTFTVYGAYGTLSGDITYNGERLTSGALILVSSASIASTPPSLAASSAPAQTVLYAASSRADGTYEVAVRGTTAYTYRLSVYVPIISGASVTITTKTYSGISIAPSAVTDFDLSVP